ncbi:putative vacuole-associated enzyme activator complex component [Cladochytrium replicatum]|nr:putative vacuole-associated enzyme activator complex component [Cladochytrium replicatum]
MDSPISPLILRGLNDKTYERRKAAATEVEKLIRELLASTVKDPNAIYTRIRQIISVLVNDFTFSAVANAKNGGLISLAATAIALGPEIGAYIDDIVPPILSCFADPDSHVRYYACESLYNVAKVARSDILKYFNEIFDSLSKLATDPASSVKNGAELLDRLIKDIVSETAIYYHPDVAAAAYTNFQKEIDNQSVRASSPANSMNTITLERPPVPGPAPPVPGTVPYLSGMKITAFNLPRFIPLLTERIRTLNSFARMFMVQWIAVLDSNPDLEIIAYLPDFLDGLFTYLSDPNMDVRVATSAVLGEFLKEIRDVIDIQKAQGVLLIKGKEGAESFPADALVGAQTPGVPTQFTSFPQSGDDQLSVRSLGTVNTTKTADAVPVPVAPDMAMNTAEEIPNAGELLPTLAYQPGQGVVLDFGRMMDILTPHLTSNDEETQATALRWVNDFILLAKEVMLPFTPLILSATLPSLAHAVTPIRNIAAETNSNLYRLIWDTTNMYQTIPLTAQSNASDASQSAVWDATASSDGIVGENISTPIVKDPIDYVSVVEILTLQLQNEHEEARAATIDWLMMLHRKAPKRVIADDVTLSALMKALTDTSDEVVRRDLQLLAQVMQNSDDEYFSKFMLNILLLFSADRRLLETRGTLIIRQLCASLNPERIYRAFAEILEGHEDLDFASTMVQNLNIILITAPEAAELRRRLKNLDIRDGVLLFSSLYRCWCHNAVAAFSLCLLAQAYEHAANLLQVFADLEITVNFLIQIDKLVQLLESPVFTYLRLQLLEPDRYPYLFKCLYGILMLLPQSSAFATLRNRLNSVSSMVMFYGHGPQMNPMGVGSVMMQPGQPPQTGAPNPVYAPGSSALPNPPPLAQVGSPQPYRPNPPAQRPKSFVSPPYFGSPVTAEQIRWQELLLHFKHVQGRHERSRRSGRGVMMDRTTSRSRRSRNSKGVDSIEPYDEPNALATGIGGLALGAGAAPMLLGNASTIGTYAGNASSGYSKGTGQRTRSASVSSMSSLRGAVGGQAPQSTGAAAGVLDPNSSQLGKRTSQILSTMVGSPPSAQNGALSGFKRSGFFGGTSPSSSTSSSSGKPTK